MKGVPYKKAEDRQERRQISLLPAEWKELDRIALCEGITRSELCRLIIRDGIAKRMMGNASRQP